MGKDLDADKFRMQLISQGFVADERIVPTPTGPLKEYLLREPKKLRDLIVVSVKGFVVDAWDYESGIDLVGLAYDVYESILGDLIRHTIVDIVGDYILTIILNKDPTKIISRIINKDAVNKLKKSLTRNDVKPFLVGFSWGIPRAPHEWIVTNISPIIGPDKLERGGRLRVTIRYRGTDPEKGVLFLREIKKIVEKILTPLITLS